MCCDRVGASVSDASVIGESLLQHRQDVLTASHSQRRRAIAGDPNEFISARCLTQNKGLTARMAASESINASRSAGVPKPYIPLPTVPTLKIAIRRPRSINWL